MAADLDEIMERLNYCDTEIAVTEKALSAYFAEVFERRSFLDLTDIVVQLRITKPLPTAIKSRIGTTIHEIRSCLDSLACQLAIRNGQKPSGTYFPISKTAAIFNHDAPKKLAKLSATDRQAILDMQTHAEARPAMFGMHEFDRVRKHRRLGVSVPANAGVGIVNGTVDNFRVLEVETLTDQWQTIVLAGHGTNAQVVFQRQAVFKEPSQLDGTEVVLGMARFLQETVDIVNTFQ